MPRTSPQKLRFFAHKIGGREELQDAFRAAADEIERLREENVLLYTEIREIKKERNRIRDAAQLGDESRVGEGTDA